MVEGRCQTALTPTEDDRPVFVMAVASGDPSIHKQIAGPHVKGSEVTWPVDVGRRPNLLERMLGGRHRVALVLALD